MTTSVSQISKHFNASDADVVIRSCDNVEFRLHKRNLEFTTGAFPPAETPTNNEIVQLSEPSETLEILFQFVYPRRFPSLDSMELESLMLVAEAAEKYEVVMAISICEFNLRKFHDTHPKRIVEFAAKHNYRELVAKMLPNLIDTDISELAEILPPYVYIPWVSRRIRSYPSNSTTSAPEHLSSLPLVENY
ncbi:hypothetical protein BDP27DRAFT_324057 [Rhodocollybia butyracea]|uniref:BTB domain-containing protein n=1 Tax=Rhodocollybia butyracea TaxID=206335 RepID=A0A9P5PEA1_9AGAR|nr:hypothetical protein BDP27DRAFT_324057 [Rhodocollybia butyracea]